jgi:hypothetical protein
MKLSEKAKALIQAVAPAIGGALGGPFGAIAGKALSTAIGADDPAKIDSMLLMDPEAAFKLRAAELEFTAKMKELDISLEDIHQRDRSSARELAKFNMLPQICLSVLFIGGYFVSLQYVLTDMGELDESIRVLAAGLLGLFTREIPTIMQFWFGSSIGSKEKTATVREVLSGGN